MKKLIHVSDVECPGYVCYIKSASRGKEGDQHVKTEPIQTVLPETKPVNALIQHFSDGTTSILCPRHLEADEKHFCTTTLWEINEILNTVDSEGMGTNLTKNCPYSK